MSTIYICYSVHKSIWSYAYMIYQNKLCASHLKKRFPRGCFGANDIHSIVHEEREAEEPKPIAVAHTHSSSYLLIGTTLGKVLYCVKTRRAVSYLFFDVVVKSKSMSEVKVRQFGKGRKDLYIGQQSEYFGFATLSFDSLETLHFLSTAEKSLPFPQQCCKINDN